MNNNCSQSSLEECLHSWEIEVIINQNGETNQVQSVLKHKSKMLKRQCLYCKWFGGVSDQESNIKFTYLGGSMIFRLAFQIHCYLFFFFTQNRGYRKGASSPPQFSINTVLLSCLILRKLTEIFLFLQNETREEN